MTLSWAALLMTMPMALLNQTMALGDSASFTTSQRRFVHCSAIHACPLELGDGTNRRDLRGLRSCARLCPWRSLLRPRTLLVGLEIESTESILIPGLVVLLASGLEIRIEIEQRERFGLAKPLPTELSPATPAQEYFVSLFLDAGAADHF